MKRHFSILLILASAILQLHAQEQSSLFSSCNYQVRFDYAKRINNRGHYLEAFDSLKVLHRDIVEYVRQKGFMPATVPNTKDFIFYQNVLISEAECAYMVNLQKEMFGVCTEHVNAINERYDEGLGRNKDYYWQIASFYKIRGDYFYLKGAKKSQLYDEARDDYNSALEYYGLAYDEQAKSKVYAELAQLEYIQGNYDEALEYIEKAVNSGSTRLTAGTNARESFATASNNTLNITYQSALAMCQARTYAFRKALSTIDGLISSLSKKDKRLPELKRRRAKILLLQNGANGTDILDASTLYETYFKAVKDSVNSNFMQMTADQREEYWMQQRPFVVDCYLLEERNPELLYDITLYNKGILLQTARSFEHILRKNESVKLNQLKQQDFQNALDGKKTSLAEDYERRLLQTVTNDGRRKKFLAPLNYTWKEVQKALPSDGCAIEFVEYEKRDSMHFGALVLRKTGKPLFLHVCNADELTDYYPDKGWLSLKESLKSTSGSSMNYIYEDHVIRDAIWNKNLISAIGNSRKVYFSADGYLHQLAIEYMLPEQLQDKTLYRLSSTRVLVEGNKIDAKKIRSGAAFVLGGIVYNSWIDKDDHHDPGNDAEAFNMLQENGSSFGYMKGAKLECDSIIYYRNNPNDLYLDSLRATEHEFYANCGKYPILHISTHGCFYGDKAIYNELLASSSKDVLSESVLALSNAGTHLLNKQFDAFNKDGLLSAREIARLNLENVELVTTSACQTGLGYITADGIYGIQRGFKSAGAKGMIMTLWSVNVESARIFFTLLYKYMGEGESVHTAFNHARNDLLTKTFTTSTTLTMFNSGTLSNKETVVTTTKQYDTPQHSCPYILIDAWE